MIASHPLAGSGLHAIGAICAALCYTPQKKTVRWSWQTYWLAQASICWLALPVLGAWLTVPHLVTVLQLAPTDAMRNAFLLGALYGIGGTAFGISIRYLGFSLTYAVAIGISCVAGTLIPPLVSGQFATLFGKIGADWIMAGVAIGAGGIFISGLAGWLKDSDLKARHAGSGNFQLLKGMLFCVAAGLLSAVFGLSLAAGQPIANVAEKYGAGQFQGNVIYIFSCSGAFLTTAIYSLYLHFRHRTFGEYVELPAGEEKAALPVNFSMAALTGALWYGQFFFYGLGHVRMGPYQFTSWAIHMTMLVLFSTLVGLLLREWKNCRSRTWLALAGAVMVLIAAVLVLTYGNYLGSQAPAS